MTLIYLQYLRGLAALAVVYYHLSLKYNDLVIVTSELPVFGSEGVNVFFVLSGFIISYMNELRAKNPMRFLWDRIVRVVPLYWFYTIIIVLAMSFFPNIVKSGTFDLNHIVASFFFVPYIHPLFEYEYWPALIPGWTLNYEMYFYFIFFCSLFFRKNVQLVFVIITIVSIIILQKMFPLIYPFDFLGNTIVLAFLFGILIAQIVINFSAKFTLKLNIFLLIALIFGCFLNLNGSLYLNVISALLVFVLITFNLTSKPIHCRTLKILGDSSYSLYLSHIFVISALNTTCKKLPFDSITNAYVFFVASFCLSIFVGILSYKFIESPLMNYFKRNKSIK